MVLFILGMGISPGTASSPDRPSSSKISGEIRMHQKVKKQPSGVRASLHTQNLTKMGLNARNLDAEDCALYVAKPLTPREVTALKSQGIEIHETYVPPVAERHPNGFYLATVRYSSLDQVESDTRILKLETTENLSEPQNDLAAIQTNVDAVHNGWGVTVRTGAGVKIAIADSGLDLTHPDIPTPAEAYDMTDGTGPSTWGTNVSNTKSAHGTHVTGIAVGSGGLSGGQYMGAAPGATLYFYKIGNDSTAGASETDEIEAVNRALTVGCKIFSMSYGGYHTYMDGSSALCQAIDAAVAAGMTCFISAGNEGARSLHYSTDVAPDATSEPFTYTMKSGLSQGTTIYFLFNWRDGTPGDGNISMTCTNLGSGETLNQYSPDSNTRGTETRFYTLTTNQTGGASKTYSFTLQNSAISGNTPKVHLYEIYAYGTFGSPDSSYTVSNPAMADSAIAVGAWTQRREWTNYLGSGYYNATYTVGTLAPFSSRGPRIDNTLKPEIVAPGAATISTRESVSGLAANSIYIIDNDGYNLDGSGPANYYLMSGTSMACPHAAGLAALVLEAHPSLTPAQLKQALTSTASQANSPNNTAGYGLLNALTAVALDFEPPTVTLTTTATEPTHLSSIPVTITLSEAATDFTDADVTATSATLQNFTGSGTTYSFDLIPTAPGAVSAQVGAGKFTDAAGNANLASNLLTRTFAPVGSLTVTLTPQGAIDAGAQWRRTGTSTWLNSGHTESALPTGSYGVEFKPITGWTIPTSQTVTVTNGATTPITGHYTIHTFTLTYAPDPHGTLEGITSQTIPYGSDGTTVTAVPEIGYRFVKWSDGSTLNPRIDTNVTTDVTVTASFAIPHTIVFQTDGTPGVTLSGNTPQTVFQGLDSTPVTAVGSASHYFVKWTLEGSDYSTANPLTVPHVTQDMVLTAVFAPRSPLIWVDFGYSGTPQGTQTEPFPTLTQGLAAVTPGGTLRITTGQTSERNRITQPVRLEAIGGPVRLGVVSK
jgi:subtilisin family serine protease